MLSILNQNPENIIECTWHGSQRCTPTQFPTVSLRINDKSIWVVFENMKTKMLRYLIHYKMKKTSYSVEILIGHQAGMLADLKEKSLKNCVNVAKSLG